MTGVQAVDWALIAPVLAPAVAAVLVLVLDAVLPRAVLAATGPVILDVTALTGLVVGVLALLPIAGDERGTFCTNGDPGGCSYAVEPVTSGLQLVILLAAAVCLLLAIGQRVGPPRAEHHLLLLAATAGAVAVAGARDLATVLVALETASLPVVGLVALRRDRRGAEAAVKLLLTSVVSVALLVLGIAMLYAASGTVYLGPLGGDGSLAPVSSSAHALAGLGLVLAVAGIAFKLSLVPFQLWTPDTYAGAPLPVAAFLAAVSKAAGLAALVVVLAAGAPLLGATWTQVIAGLAVVTMTVGNLVALRQTRMLRLLAWSSVAQAGYIIAPLAVGGRGIPAAAAYAVFFVLLEFVAFGAIVALRPPGADGGEIAAYRGSARRSPWLGAALVLAFAGLAGLPPGLAGLFAKVTIVDALIDTGWGALAGVVALNAVIALAYYVRVTAILYASPPGLAVADLRQPKLPVPWPVATALVAASALVLALGFAPQLLFDSLSR